MRTARTSFVRSGAFSSPEPLGFKKRRALGTRMDLEMRRKLLPTSPSLISYDLREVNNHIVVLAFFSLVAFRFIVKLSISSFRLAQ